MSEPSMSAEEFCNMLAAPECEFGLISTRVGMGYSLTLELHVRPGEDAPGQVWQVVCTHVWGKGETRGNTCKCCLHSEHPLLWKFVYREMALCFHGRPACVEEMIGWLYRVHYDTAGKELPFEQFFNTLPLPQLLEGGHGMLARGPEPLVSAYQQALEKQHVPNSFLLYPVKRRSNLPVDKPLYLFQMGSSYYITTELEVRRVS